MGEVVSVYGTKVLVTDTTCRFCGRTFTARGLCRHERACGYGQGLTEQRVHTDLSAGGWVEMEFDGDLWELDATDTAFVIGLRDMIRSHGALGEGGDDGMATEIGYVVLTCNPGTDEWYADWEGGTIYATRESGEWEAAAAADIYGAANVRLATAVAEVVLPSTTEEGT